MLIAVISDIHDNIPNLAKCLDWCRHNKVKKIIFCGDTTTEETLSYLAREFSGEIFMVSGNGELFEPDRLNSYRNISYHGRAGYQELDGCPIGFCHEPVNIKKVLTLSSQTPDFIFYGHTHQPWLDKRGPMIVANPGNLSGTFHQATFAALDTESGKLELKILAEL